MMPGGRTPGVDRRVFREAGARVRVFRPAEPSGAGLLWIHGGGLIGGAASQDDWFCGETASSLGVTIVSVDYRLAPRHPYPAAIDDCAAAFAWLREKADAIGIDPERLAIGGQSAGGGLAACLVQRLTDQGTLVRAQWLFCPMLDDRTALDRSLDALRHPVWDNTANRAAWACYLGGAAAARAPYAAAARRTDVSGLPPTWIGFGDVELFAAENVGYARRLIQAGVPTEVDSVPGAPHAFETWAFRVPLARALRQRARSWLGAQLASR